MGLTIGRKLGLGFAAVLLLMAASATVAYIKVTQMYKGVGKLADEAFPTIAACDEMLNSLERTVSTLRGYFILGDNPKEAEFFKEARAKAWKSIDEAAARLTEIYQHSTQSGDRKNFETILANLEDLRKAQQDVEDIAQTDKNIPSYQVLFADVVPRADKVLALTAKIIDGDESLEATPQRKALLKSLVEFRDSFARAPVDLRAYLPLADARFKRDFETKWQVNQNAYDKIDNQAELLTGKLGEQWEQLKKLRSEFETFTAQLFTARQAKDWNQAHYRMESLANPRQRAIRDALYALKKTARERAVDDRKDLDAATGTATWTLIVAPLVAILLGAVIAVLLSRNITKAVGRLLAAVRVVATGDLKGEAVRLASRDEIGELARGFNEMVSSLRRILSETTAMTSEVTCSSGQIAAASQKQAASLNQTAASLNQITATAEQFKVTMQEFADRAGAVREAANETAKRSANGRTLTQESAVCIEQVRTNAQVAGESVLKLSEQMQRIGVITATVNEIAEQTKLLALNASIEAARAGDSGRGFAVVATQVRELANQSKQAAGRIESLIADTHKSMHDVVNKMEEGSRLSQDASEIGRQVTQSFDEISQAFEQTHEAMVQISTGAKEQERGIVALANGIAEIDSGSKESLTAAEQTQKSIVAIDQRIRALNDSLSRFKT